MIYAGIKSLFSKFYIEINLKLIYRSVQLFYEKKIDYDGIPGFRYKIGNNFLNDLDECFCTDRIKVS